MGHDISAYKTEYNEERDDEREEIAYLRRGAFNPLKDQIYEALNAENHNCGCSGCGGEQKFTIDEIRAALDRLPAGDDAQPEREFLSDIVASGLKEVWIDFY